MKRQSVTTNLLVFALAAVSAAATAQDVLSTRTETQRVAIISTDAGGNGTGMAAVVQQTVGPDFLGETVTRESEVTLLGFQIPDFNPDDLTTHMYHVGMFSDTGNGSGTIYPNDDGYAEFELRTDLGREPMRTFLYSTHIDTGEVRVFIDVDDVTVNRAAMILTNLELNSSMASALSAGARPPFGQGRARRMPAMPPPIGDERRVSLVGDYLTLDDLQDQIFEQTRCVLELEDGRYYLAGCD